MCNICVHQNPFYCRKAERLAAKKKAKEAAAAAAVVKTEEGEGAEGATEESSDGKPVLQVGSLTQFYAVNFSRSMTGVQKCVGNKRAIEVCISCF